MTLTATRRKIKLKTQAQKDEKLSWVLMAVGLVLLTFGDPHAGHLSILAGGRLFLNSRDELRNLQHPHSFRNIYPDTFRCTLDSFHDDEYHDLFRFDKPTARAFVNYLTRFCHIPNIVSVPYLANNRVQHYVYTIEELLLMTLMYSSTPCRQLEVSLKFGRTPPEVSRGITYFHDLLFPISKSFLQNDQQPWFDIQCAMRCAEVIANKGCPLEDCVGFVDGTLQQTSNPSVAWLQTHLYNGHKKFTGYNWIGVSLPNGMCAFLLGPSEGRRHDAACSARHRLYEKLNAFATFPTFEGCFGGDSAFPTYWPIVPIYGTALTPAQADWNTDMSSVRISVEWMFGQTVQQFPCLDWKRRQKVLASPVHKWFLNMTFLNNILNTSYPNQISQYFEMRPPRLEKYLNVPDGSLQ